MVNIYAPGHRNRNPFGSEGQYHGSTVHRNAFGQEIPGGRINTNMDHRAQANRNAVRARAAASRSRGRGSVRGLGGGGGRVNKYASSIDNPFSKQDIQEQRNAAHANFVQQQQNPNSALSRRLAGMSSRFGPNSGLAQSAQNQAALFTDAAGREQARQAGNQMVMQNQQYGVLPRSQEGLQLASMAMQQNEGAANRAASLQSGLLSGLLGMMMG